MDPAWVKEAQERLYAGGEYYALSAVLAPAADALVAAAAVEPGDTVLDVGAGDGNVAVAAARRGARVVACDLAPSQVERGEARCRRDRTPVEWLVADAEQLPFDAESFTHVLSAFGVVFAPRPELATLELFRVCRPGGVVALTSGPDGSFMADLTSEVRALSSEDDPFPDIELSWGDEERFGRVYGRTRRRCASPVARWYSTRRSAAAPAPPIAPRRGSLSTSIPLRSRSCRHVGSTCSPNTAATTASRAPST